MPLPLVTTLMLPSFSRTASLTSLILSTPCSRMAISTSVSLRPSLSSAALLTCPSSTTTVGGGSINASNQGQRLRSMATARLKTSRMATMIAPPSRILVGYWMPEPEIKQGCRVGEMLRAPQHHDHDGAAVSRCGGRQAVAGGAGIAGLDADRASIGPQQPIDVDWIEGFVLRRRVNRDLFRADDGAQVRIIGEQRRPHDREVVGRAVVIRFIEPARVGEVRRAQVQ